MASRTGHLRAALLHVRTLGSRGAGTWAKDFGIVGTRAGSKPGCRGWRGWSMMTAMGAARVRAGEIETSVELVRRLLAGQFPHWAGLRIGPVASYGTDHDIYRLGHRLAAWLSRIGRALDYATIAYQG